MYEYKYERVKVVHTNWKFVGGLVSETIDYKEIIEKRSLEGWRFVTWIPVKQIAEGIIVEIDLVFEREKN